MIHVTLPDETVLEMPDGSSAADVAVRIGPGLAKAALGANARYDNGEITLDLATPLNRDCGLSILTRRDAQALTLLRHSTAHVMAEAIGNLWPETKLVFLKEPGPPEAPGRRPEKKAAQSRRDTTPSRALPALCDTKAFSPCRLCQALLHLGSHSCGASRSSPQFRKSGVAPSRSRIATPR